jgi:anthranilate phosphoribosyltransferase
MSLTTPQLRTILDELLDGRSLDEAAACDLMVALTATELAPAMCGAMLAALRAKGTSAAELRGLARGLRSLARRPHLPSGIAAVDIVGTGGDRSGSLNLSTGAALLAASCGLPVFKHGNRSISSRAGSADVLEILGVPIPMDEATAGACFAATGFTFLFAPYYHPAMKQVAPVRAALGVRTVFNVLGPLSNPAEPPYYVLGAFSAEIAERMAEALTGMNIRRAFVVHGAEGWDEPTPIGPFTLYDVQPGNVRREQRAPADYGFDCCVAEALAGADAAHNAAALQRVFKGEDRGPHRDALLLGAALALEVTGREPDRDRAVRRAAQALDDGAGTALLERLHDFGAEHRAGASA